MNNNSDKQIVLVVDDKPENIHLLLETLSWDYKVIVARNGERALHLAHTAPMPDIILLDVMMPAMSGYEVCSRLKADNATKDIPVIFITGMSGEEDERKGLELGAVDYIAKPFNAALIMARVRNHLALRAYHNHLEYLVELELRERLLAEERSRQSEEKYKALFEDAQDIVFISTPAGKLLDINPAGIKILGYSSKEEVLSLSIENNIYYNPDDRRQLCTTLEKFGSVKDFPIDFKHRKGPRLSCLVTATVWTDGMITEFRGIVRDITQQKLMEDQLNKARQMETIGKLAGGFAHEVRNPLNAILSITEALFKEKEVGDNPELQPYIHHIRTQINRLSQLMKDLLDLGKPISPSSLTIVPLAKLCEESIAVWKSAGISGNYVVRFVKETKGSPLVTAAAGRLEQILLNLLDNAAQHSVAGSEIKVSITDASENMVKICITDSGPGISPDKMDQIFEPFYTSRKGGTGLGLTLVRHFAENMKGTVSVYNNDPLPGCTFEVILLLAEENVTK